MYLLFGKQKLKIEMITSPKNVNEYISTFPLKVRKILQQLRKVIITAAPAADEVISYHMPAYKYQGMLVYFAAHKNHIGFYPFTSAVQAFKKELSVYESSNGTVRFSFDEPLPVNLIAEIIKYRMKENLEKAAAKKKIRAISKTVKSKNDRAK